MPRIPADCIPGIANSVGGLGSNQVILCWIIFVLFVIAMFLVWKIWQLRLIFPPNPAATAGPPPSGGEKKVLASSRQTIFSQLQELSGIARGLIRKNTEHFDAVRKFQDAFQRTGPEEEAEEIRRQLLEEMDRMLKSCEKFGATLNNATRQFGRRQESMEQILVDSSLDYLTRLGNRRVFDSRLKEELFRTRRYGKPFALIMMDIDHFKAVNDDHGHLTGDQIIKLAAQAMEAQVRITDFVARFGGEEFVILLPEATGEEGRAVAEKVRQAVRNIRLNYGDRVIQITISAGVTVIDPSNDTPESLVNRVDRALLRAKKNGRNRVELIMPNNE